MTPPDPPTCRPRRAAAAAAWAALFALSYTQAPPYYSNQNQYLLHGLAAADGGALADDWLANTLSPTPVFDALVAFTARHLGEGLFPLYYAALQGVYFLSLLGVAESAAGGRLTPRTRPLFAALVLLSHAALPRWASFTLLGWDYPCYLQGWLAAQYLLGPVFQPSAFGVLLVASLDQFLRRSSWPAAALVAAAVTLHPTYALSGGLLMLGYLVTLVRDGRAVEALICARTAGVLSVWALGFAAWAFRPTTPEAFAEAQRLLVSVRIPHHAAPAVWFDAVAAAQLLGVAAAVWLTRGTRLFRLLLTLAGGALLLTLAQLATGNDSLALVFPWRSSTLLIPLATAILLARLVGALGPRLDRPAAAWMAALIVGTCATGGAALMLTGQGYAANPAERPLFDFVRDHGRPGDVYLLPPQLPKPPPRWGGSVSSDFKPLASPANGRAIPADLQRFRLAARAAVYVDFKAIPYKDVEVLEWHRRLRWAARLYESRTWPDAARWELYAEGVTHVVAPAERDVAARFLELQYADADFRLYRVRR